MMSLHLTVQLAIFGLIVATLPLATVWVATDRNKFRKLASVTLFLTFDLIVFGAYTRLTDSGLGCPDWPGCYGHANPLQAHLDISTAQALMPQGPVTVMKAWIEMIHRYLAMAVGVLIIALMLVAWRRWWSTRADRRRSQSGDASVRDTSVSPWLPTVLLGFVCLQGAFGAWTVTQKLQPVIVTIHLLLGLSLLSLLALLRAQQQARPAFDERAASVRLPAVLALSLLAIQLALGGWVSTNYAALACTDYPLCHGAVLPTMEFGQGFTLWRQLGKTAGGEYLPFAALTAIHWVHRNFAMVVIAAAVWAGVRAYRVMAMRRIACALLGVIALQFLTGVLTIYLQWPLALAVLHSAGAALLVLVLVMLNYRTFACARHPAVQPASWSDGPARTFSYGNL